MSIVRLKGPFPDSVLASLSFAETSHVPVMDKTPFDCNTLLINAYDSDNLLLFVSLNSKIFNENILNSRPNKKISYLKTFFIPRKNNFNKSWLLLLNFFSLCSTEVLGQPLSFVYKINNDIPRTFLQSEHGQYI